MERSNYKTPPIGTVCIYDLAPDDPTLQDFYGKYLVKINGCILGMATCVILQILRRGSAQTPIHKVGDELFYLQWDQIDPNDIMKMLV